MRLQRGERRLYGERSADGIEAEVSLEVRTGESRQRLEIDRADGIDEAARLGPASAATRANEDASSASAIE